MSYQKIPNSVKIGGQVLDVRFVERIDGNNVGEMCLANGYIEIAQKFNKDLVHVFTGQVNTFYHEVVHAILDTMGESELSKNEKFVCCFGGFLTDAMEKAVFEEDDNKGVSEMLGELARSTMIKTKE